MFGLGVLLGIVLSSWFWYEFWRQYDFIDKDKD